MGKGRYGVFGGSESGKTTLVKHLVPIHFEKHKMDALVLDPIGDDWGEHSKRFGSDQEEAFWKEVWSSRNKVIVIDEGTEMIARDKTLIPVFTRLRHCHHVLYVIGHRGDSLLPVMRDQLSTVYLFRQNPSSAKIWSETFACEDIMLSTGLRQYEFLICDRYDAKTGLPVVRKRKLELT
jgi:molybdopterin-guanine dinucleotide biosynthesis protein